MAFTEDDFRQLQMQVFELTKKLTEAQGAIVAAQKNWKKDVGALTSKRGFGVLEHWGGKETDFEERQWKMRCFLQEELGWAEVLRIV